MKRIILVLLVVAFGSFLRFSPALAQEKTALDPHTLLLVHFNNGFNADYAKGDGKVIKKDNRDGAVLTEGKFGKGIRIPKGAFGIAYSGKDNLNPAVGTIEFWIKGEFQDAPSNADALGWQQFSPVFFDNRAGAGFVIGKSQYGQVYCNLMDVGAGYKTILSLKCVNGGTDKINDGKWHHLAFAWDKDSAAFFLDGKLKDYIEGPVYAPPGHVFGDILIGYEFLNDYFYGQTDKKEAFMPMSAEATIDELRISDVVRYTTNFTPPEKEF
jgi:hypothetical protein